MKKQKTTPAAPDIEQYLNFSTEHDNEHALDVWLEAMKSGIFTDPTTPLRVFVELRNPLIRVSEQPSKVIPLFEQYTDGMDTAQKLFIARRVYYYFKNTVFGATKEGEYLTGISKPLDAYIERLGRESGETVIKEKTNDLRQTLKDIFRQEMERLPEYLQSLETKDRVNVLCKMIPYVLPKVESVHFSEGDSFSFL